MKRRWITFQPCASITPPWSGNLWISIEFRLVSSLWPPHITITNRDFTCRTLRHLGRMTTSASIGCSMYICRRLLLPPISAARYTADQVMLAALARWLFRPSHKNPQVAHISHDQLVHSLVHSSHRIQKIFPLRRPFLYVHT